MFLIIITLAWTAWTVWENLKNRLSKSIDTLAKYDILITDQLEHGVTEKVETIGIPVKVKYLPHQAALETTIAQKSLV